MALPHAQPLQPIDILPEAADWVQAKSRALFKSDQLELMQLVLRAGQSLPPHQVRGEITLQCVAGRIVVEADGVQQPLGAGQLLYLGAGAMHGVQALADSCVLLTVVLCH